MAHSTISAEIETPPGKERQAAAALQRLGFRVLHIGTTVSTTGPADLWTRHFGVTFTTVDKETAPGQVTSWQRPAPTGATIPAALRGTVVDVHFVEPPEWY